MTNLTKAEEKQLEKINAALLEKCELTSLSTLLKLKLAI